VGDDVVDLPVMTRVGLAIAVQDAHYLAKQHAHWVTPSGGGRGAAREVCELLMDAQGNLDNALQFYVD
jgi:3-deoxy-D-manno-octulosonate 8-phosphate phosphatase (KDO 8-P phosphatase)